MNKYLKEIETAGIIMLFIGVIVGHFINMTFGAIAAIIGILLWGVTVVTKAMNWQQYRRDNLVNIAIILGAIAFSFISLLFFYR